MRISKLENWNVNFQRKLTASEKKEVAFLHSEIPKMLDTNGDKILILHDTSLPYNAQMDIGIGHLNSKEGIKFLKDAKSYLGINKIELHPQGEYHIRPVNGFCCPYAGSGMSLGAHIINPTLLTQKQYGKLLSKADIIEIVKTNTAPDKETISNFENIIPENSGFEKVLKKSFENFNKLPQNNKLKKEFDEFTNKNKDWLEPQGIYKVLKSKHKSLSKDWNELDRNLFNTDYPEEKRIKRIAEIRKNNNSDIEFFKFKQFLSDKMLRDAKSKINRNGLKLIGDCHIGWGDQDIFTNPKAFYKNISIGWGLPAINYDNVLDKNSEAFKLLHRKVELCAQRYDGIRFDVAWAYLSPRLINLDTKTVEHRLLNTDAIISEIENTVKKVKGTDYDLKNLIYEFEASGEDFSLTPRHKSFISNRSKVYSMQYMDYDWGHLEAYKNIFGSNEKSFVIGLGNQDGVPHRNIATMKPVNLYEMQHEERLKLLVDVFGGDVETLKKKPDYEKTLVNKYNELISHKSAQANLLASKYHTTAEHLLSNPVEFAKYKATEAFNSKNTMLYFLDMFGSKNVFDAHTINGNKNYRYRITPDYLNKYIESIIKGYGINMFDIYEKLFIQKGLDKRYPEYFKQIQKYKNILLSTGKTPIHKTLPAIAAGGTIGGGLLLFGVKYLNKKEAVQKHNLLGIKQ